MTMNKRAIALMKQKRWDQLIELASDFAGDLESSSSEETYAKFVLGVLMKSRKYNIPASVIDSICAIRPAFLFRRDKLGQAPIYAAVASSVSFEVFQVLLRRCKPHSLVILQKSLNEILPEDVVERYIYPYAADNVMLDRSPKSGNTVMHLLITMLGSALDDGQFDFVRDTKKCISSSLKHFPCLGFMVNKMGASPLHHATFYLRPTVLNWSVYARLLRAFPDSLEMRDIEERTPYEIFLDRNADDISNSCPLIRKYVKILNP